MGGFVLNSSKYYSCFWIGYAFINHKTVSRKLPAKKIVKRNIIPLRVFTYFDAVVRHGSMRKAAESLHIASSALNRRILDLENELGTDLFERLPRGVRLTAAGEIFIGYVRRSLTDLDLVRSQIEHLRGLVRGQVRIAAAESLASVLPRAIVKFHGKYERVQFHVRIGTPDELVTSLLDDGVDIVLGYCLPENRHISVLHSIENPLCAVVNRSHPIASLKSLRLRDCLAYPVTLADPILAGRGLIDSVLAKASYSFEPALVSNSVEVMKSYAQLSEAVCFQFKSGVGLSGGQDDMVAIPLTDPELAHTQLVLAVHRNRVLPVAVTTFAETMRELLAAL